MTIVVAMSHFETIQKMFAYAYIYTTPTCFLGEVRYSAIAILIWFIRLVRIISSLGYTSVFKGVAIDYHILRLSIMLCTTIINNIILGKARTFLGLLVYFFINIFWWTARKVIHIIG